MTPLIKVNSLSKIFHIRGHRYHAIQNICFSLNRGQTLGLVGESGSGKSTLAKTLVSLYKPDSGEIYYDGTLLSKKNIKKFRSKIQLVFQNPGSSLNPRMTAEEIISEPLDISRCMSTREREKRVRELFMLVGLKPFQLKLYPHEFSGGQKQRIAIARALSLNPEFLILDEPISALDVSIQAQIVTLLKDLQKKLNLTYLFISHDLSMVKYLSDYVAVMYLGEIVEMAEAKKLFNSPLHPYTKGLIDAIAHLDPSLEKNRVKTLLKGDVPNLLHRGKGCTFYKRCPNAMPQCYAKENVIKEAEDNHQVRCHLYSQLNLNIEKKNTENI
ncbi:MAG: oligopeptide/dipeptide ABC transporter ATP-binding protein [Simkaniaceae bacterium]